MPMFKNSIFKQLHPWLSEAAIVWWIRHKATNPGVAGLFPRFSGLSDETLKPRSRLRMTYRYYVLVGHKPREKKLGKKSTKLHAKLRRKNVNTCMDGENTFCFKKKKYMTPSMKINLSNKFAMDFCTQANTSCSAEGIQSAVIGVFPPASL